MNQILDYLKSNILISSIIMIALVSPFLCLGSGVLLFGDNAPTPDNTIVIEKTEVPVSTQTPYILIVTATSIPKTLTETPSITSTSEPDREEAHVIEVIDGDTVDLINGEKVRLLGIDSPDYGECGYEEAKKYLESLVLDKVVILHDDSLADDIDQYGRLLRYLEIDGKDVNLWMVIMGFGDSFRYDSSSGYPYERENQYHEAQGVILDCREPTATVYKAPTVVAIPTVSSPCSGRVFTNCTEMKAAGCAPAIQGRDDWYRSARDGDNDGIACE